MIVRGSKITTCDDVCANNPSYYVSKIPALVGERNGVANGEYNAIRMDKLAGAISAFLVGCGLLVFHTLDAHTNTYASERQLIALVKATGVTPVS